MKYYTVNYPSDPEIKDWLLSNYWTILLAANVVEFGVYFYLWASILGI